MGPCNPFFTLLPEWYIYFWPCQEACGDLSSPTRDWTWATAVTVPNPNPRITRTPRISLKQKDNLYSEFICFKDKIVNANGHPANPLLIASTSPLFCFWAWLAYRYGKAFAFVFLKPWSCLLLCQVQVRSSLSSLRGWYWSTDPKYFSSTLLYFLMLSCLALFTVFVTMWNDVIYLLFELSNWKDLWEQILSSYISSSVMFQNMDHLMTDLGYK